MVEPREPLVRLMLPFPPTTIPLLSHVKHEDQNARSRWINCWVAGLYRRHAWLHDFCAAGIQAGIPAALAADGPRWLSADARGGAAVSGGGDAAPARGFH